MGEIFYSRFIPSVGRYISFRVASASATPVPYIGPVGPKPAGKHAQLRTLSDPALLQTWLSAEEGAAAAHESTPRVLLDALSSEHSWPAVGQWDGSPFGYFDVYWAIEENIGRCPEADIGDWDRGLRVKFVMESAWEVAPAWVTSLVHWSFTADLRTMTVFVEFGADTERFVSQSLFLLKCLTFSRALSWLEQSGFMDKAQVSVSQLQSRALRFRREIWRGPSL
jgi:hypothetical protein